MKTLFLALLLVQAPAPSRTGNGVVVGKILSTDGTPSVGVRVAAVPVPESNQPAGTPVLASIGQTDSSGSFRLENIPPGRYYIMAGLVDRPMYFPGVDTMAAASVVNVTANAPVSGVEFRLQRAVNLKVSGRVLGIAVLPGPLPFTVTLLPRTPPFAAPFPNAPVKSDFTYELTNVSPGNYSVQVTSPGTSTMKDTVIITVADKDLTGIDVAMVDTATRTKLEGLGQVWSLAGTWGAVVGDEKTGILHASGAGTRVEIDAAGKVQREIPFPRSSVWRLAHFAGVSEPVFLTGSGALAVIARTASGNPLWSYPDATAGLATGIDDVWPIDLDGDQSDEVVVGFNGGTGLHVLNSKGQVLWKFTSIGNVWHVAGGDVRGNGRPQVVTTSATGKVHVFSDNGTAKIDLDPGVYANMVRVGKVSGTDAAATIIAGGTNTGNTTAVLTALSGDGTKKWSLQLQAPGRPSLYSAYLAPGKPWIAVGMQTGVVYVVDTLRGAVIATIDGLGQTPEIAWIAGKDAEPLLIISTRTNLTAYRVAEAKGR